MLTCQAGNVYIVDIKNPSNPKFTDQFNPSIGIIQSIKSNMTEEYAIIAG